MALYACLKPLLLRVPCIPNTRYCTQHLVLVPYPRYPSTKYCTLPAQEHTLDPAYLARGHSYMQGLCPVYPTPGAVPCVPSTKSRTLCTQRQELYPVCTQHQVLYPVCTQHQVLYPVCTQHQVLYPVCTQHQIHRCFPRAVPGIPTCDTAIED